MSTEEIQIALYQLWPDLTDPATNRRNVERNHLRELIQAHRGIVDMCLGLLAILSLKVYYDILKIYYEILKIIIQPFTFIDCFLEAWRSLAHLRLRRP